MPFVLRTSFLSSIALCLGLLLGVPAAAQTELADRMSPPQKITDVRKHAHDGDWVTIEGQVNDSKGDYLFEIEDESGRMVVRIPDHLQRDQGSPNFAEVIRVSGKYGSRTLLDKRGETQGPVKGGERSWGVRVQKLARNLPTSHTNPDPADVKVEFVPIQSFAETGAPAALEPMSVTQPQASRDLKSRMRAARIRVDAAQEPFDEAQLAYAKGLHQGVGGRALDELIANRDRAEGALLEAGAAIPPLVEEARAAGIDETLIRLYEQSASPTR